MLFKKICVKKNRKCKFYTLLFISRFSGKMCHSVLVLLVALGMMAVAGTWSKLHLQYNYILSAQFEDCVYIRRYSLMIGFTFFL